MCGRVFVIVGCQHDMLRDDVAASDAAVRHLCSTVEMSSAGTGVTGTARQPAVTVTAAAAAAT
jgi:hypothetical protein